MRALVCTRLGDPTDTGDNAPLQWVPDHPTPQLPATHVRIRVAAAGLNFADALQVKGQYQERPPLPFVPGAECSGIIAEVGPQAAAIGGLTVGDRVVAVCQGGCLADEVVVHAAGVYRVPDGVDLESAAGLPVAFGTSYLALVDRAHIQPGQTVLVLGAAGGVGLAAVQIAKAVGCRVVAVARGPGKAAALRALGADVALDSAELEAVGTPLHKAVKQAEPKGVHAVFDPVGGSFFSEALRCCAWGAQLLIIGFASGHIPKVPANIALVKNLTVHGIYWGSYMRNDPRTLAAGMMTLLSWHQSGRISVRVSHRFSMDKAPAAFSALLSRKVVGKILLVPPPGGSTAAGGGGGGDESPEGGAAAGGVPHRPERRSRL